MKIKCQSTLTGEGQTAKILTTEQKYNYHLGLQVRPKMKFNHQPRHTSIKTSIHAKHSGL